LGKSGQRARAPGQLCDADRAIGSGHAELPARELQVGRGRFKEVGGQTAAPVDGGVAGEGGGASRHHQRARRHARRAGGYHIAIALHEPHRAHVDAQPGGNQGWERGQVALSHRLHPGAQHHRPIGLEQELHRLVEDAARHLQEAG
jgi:hypothetical protein